MAACPAGRGGGGGGPEEEVGVLARRLCLGHRGGRRDQGEEAEQQREVAEGALHRGGVGGEGLSLARV